MVLFAGKTDPCLSALYVPPWPKRRYINTLSFLSFTLLVWLTRACRPILLISTVLVHQIHLAAYGLLDAVCTQITKSVFPEVVQNSSSFPCSEKSLSIPVFQVCGHPVTVQHWFIPNPELISKNISKWFFQPAVNKSGYPSASDSFTLIISQVYVDSDHIRNFQPHPGYVTTLPENT